MVIGRLVLPMKPQKYKIVKFVPRPRVWKLKDEETPRLKVHLDIRRLGGGMEMWKKWLPN